jgi:HD-like signal output (HDOD) protein
MKEVISWCQKTKQIASNDHKDPLVNEQR